ncbi:unnamed protein product [Ceratitis capitata]|uniref:(Mediterranean fruit fly) hypothetical protein n=1 Tax=Ceratitis capitata TaxID=7213 RepID=A0A811V616_CERCA|nr:unnamed protein product [Ceratitis capitata]
MLCAVSGAHEPSRIMWLNVDCTSVTGAQPLFDVLQAQSRHQLPRHILNILLRLNGRTAASLVRSARAGILFALAAKHAYVISGQDGFFCAVLVVLKPSQLK